MVMFQRPFPMTQPVVELRGFKKGLDSVGFSTAKAVAYSNERMRNVDRIALNSFSNYAQGNCIENTGNWPFNSVNGKGLTEQMN